MRIWSIHPAYLDCKGLTALWREGLLAQKVLSGETQGYKNHPQLHRFKKTSKPLLTISSYLAIVQQEATYRGYHFDIKKIISKKSSIQIPVTRGQILYEFSHLLTKLEKRDISRYMALKDIQDVRLHPLFYVVDGETEEWEIIKV